MLMPADTSLDKLVQRAPGVLAQPTGSGQLAILVRGIGLVGDTTTAIYFGDVALSGPQGTGSDAAPTSSELALIDTAQLDVSRHSPGAHKTGTASGGEEER